MAPSSNSVAPFQREMRLEVAAMKAQLPDRNRFSALSCSPAAMMPEVTREYQKSVTSRAAASLYTGLIFPSSPRTATASHVHMGFCLAQRLLCAKLPFGWLCTNASYSASVLSVINSYMAVHLQIHIKYV